MTTDWLATSDPAWYPRVLAILQRDYPDIADITWARAISENAARTCEPAFLMNSRARRTRP